MARFTIEFIKGGLDLAVPARFIFNRTEHLRIQSTSNWVMYQLTNRGSHYVFAQVFFHVNGHKASSPYRAPFGSIEVFKSPGVEILTSFIKWFENDLKETGVRLIVITHYPEQYDPPSSNNVNSALKMAGFSSVQEVSSIIEISIKSFEHQIRSTQLPRLMKAGNLMQAKQVPLKQLKNIYMFLEEVYRNKNRRLSMTYAELYRTAKQFQNDFLLFETREGKTRTAAAIVIRINSDILYTFYYGHDHDYDKISPMVFLIGYIYGFARQNGYLLIDLGTSMNGSMINQPLLQFKKNMGGKASKRYRFEKVLV